MDDIEDIAALGIKYNIPVHVDACLGSFVVALARDAGYTTKPFDFKQPGVTSISADTHKVPLKIFFFLNSTESFFFSSTALPQKALLLFYIPMLNF